VLPAERCHPQAMDENDGVDWFAAVGHLNS
jgi:hypothetical protein